MDMKRKIDMRLDNWAKERETALLITGARQVGKTYSDFSGPAQRRIYPSV